MAHQRRAGRKTRPSRLLIRKRSNEVSEKRLNGWCWSLAAREEARQGRIPPLAVEEELQQQKLIVKSANRTKDHFQAMLSHELRTPLTPVISALELLETAPAQTNGDRSVEPKSDLEPKIAHLLSIDVADYSKLSNNKHHQLNPSSVSTVAC